MIPDSKLDRVSAISKGLGTRVNLHLPCRDAFFQPLKIMERQKGTKKKMKLISEK